MTASSLLIFIILGCLLSSCEQTNGIPINSDGELLPYLMSMKNITVSFNAQTKHYRYERQTTFDPGTTSYFEGERNYWFTNSDSTFTLEWLDSGFTSKSTFGFRQFTPFPTATTYPKTSTSTIAGFYDPVANTLRDVRCVFKFTENVNHDDYQFANASLAISEMERGAVTEDSVEFIATGSNLRSIVSLGYAAEEYWYGGDYTKKSRLDAIMWDEPSVVPTLRVVFYK